MNTQSILTRVKLKHIKGATLGYLYNFEFLKSLNPSPRESIPSETLLNVDDIITYEGKKFKIKAICSKFFSETDDFSDGKGVNLLGIGGQLPFNFQITYILDDYN